MPAVIFFCEFFCEFDGPRRERTVVCTILEDTSAR